MTRNRYYRQEWAPEGVDVDVLEKALAADVEGPGLDALRKIVERAALDENQVSHALIYLAFQRIRVPRQADIAKQLFKNEIESDLIQHEMGTELLSRGQIEISDSFRFEYMKRTLGLFAPYFMRMKWMVLTCPSDTGFITSDSPVSIVNGEVIPPDEPGLRQVGTQVLFPIDKKHLLVMYHPEAPEGVPPLELVEEPKGLETHINVEYGVELDCEGADRENWFVARLSGHLVVGPHLETVKKASQIRRDRNPQRHEASRDKSRPT